VVGKVCKKALGIRSQGKKGFIGWGGISIFAMILRVGNWNLKLWCNWKGVQKMPCGIGAGEERLFSWEVCTSFQCFDCGLVVGAQKQHLIMSGVNCLC
jgi:hypothetical protein